jgi:Holliday junction resolvase RusA-like endonuclease
MDVDNLAKGVLDVMEQGGVVVNDDQVTLLEVSKEYGGEPCIEIVIQVL